MYSHNITMTQEVTTVHAMIMGGGIAGPATAMALQRAGIDATVYEAYDRTADGVGAFLTLAVNGLDALRLLGLDDHVTRLGIDTPRITLRNGAGRPLATFANGPRRPDGTVSSTLRRADLYVALRDEAVRRGVEVRYGKRLVDARSEADGVVAWFADGSSARGDLLIGADGLRSQVRRVIDPSAPPARYVGLLNTGGFTRGVEVDAPPGDMQMVFGRRCFFGYLPAPDGSVWWFANPPRAEEPADGELAASTEAWRAELVALLEADAGPAAELVRRAHELLPAWPTHDLPSVPTWHRGRMVIVGDAAHATSPSSGQGASMALEDAVVLAKALRDGPDVPGAFAAYEQQRRARVERVVAHGKRTGDHKAPGPLGRVVRDLFIRVALPLQSRLAPRSLAWLYDHRIDWDEPVGAAAA